MRYAITIVIVMSAATGRVHAQANAVAEQLFKEGRELEAQGKWAEACPKFEASLQRDPALGTRLNLATCYQHVGKTASAWALFRESADIAKQANDAKRADFARQQALALEPRLPKLVIMAPAKVPAGLVVHRDGAAVSAAELGVALYVDPGAHEVKASAPGFESSTSSVIVEDGRTTSLTLPDLAARPKAAQAPPVTPVDKSVEVPEGLVSPTRKYVALGVGGGGIVLAGVGLVFGAQAMSKNNKAKDLCGPDLACSGDHVAEGRQLVHDGRTQGTMATVFVAAGVAAIGAGVAIYLTAPRATEGRRQAAIVPIIGLDRAGLGVVGRF